MSFVLGVIIAELFLLPKHTWIILSIISRGKEILGGTIN
jgi:hypothetical protein